MRPIFLIGFMGSGKTTLARAVSRRTGWQFIDLDFYIENRFRKSVRDIFAQEGEERFRDLEARMLREVGEFEDVIVACGGGTPCFGSNMDYMLGRGPTVFLDATEPCLHRRLVKGRFKRPLIADKTPEEVLEVIRRGIASRIEHYSRASLVFPSDNLEDSAQIAESVDNFLTLIDGWQEPSNTETSE